MKLMYEVNYEVKISNPTNNRRGDVECFKNCCPIYFDMKYHFIRAGVCGPCVETEMAATSWNFSL